MNPSISYTPIQELEISLLATLNSLDATLEAITNAKLAKDFIDSVVDEYIGTIKTVLEEHVPKIHMIGGIAGAKAAEKNARMRLPLAFDMVESDALHYARGYVEELKKGGCTIDGEFVPWLENRGKAIREGLGDIIKSSLEDGGSTLKDVKDDIRDLMDIENRRAWTIARTEMKRVEHEGERASWERLNIEKVQWLLNSVGPCEECQAIADYNDGIYTIDEVPFIPVHPNCGCTTIPIIDDSWTPPDSSYPLSPEDEE